MAPHTTSPVSRPRKKAKAVHSNDSQTSVSNRPDEWKIEQGLSGAVLPVLDMTGPETKAIPPHVFGELTKDEAAIKAVGDPKKLFQRERKGWKGFVNTTFRHLVYRSS
jgi:hypothetical protein